VGGTPDGLSLVAVSIAQQEGFDALTRTPPVINRIGAGTAEVADGLMPAPPGSGTLT